MTEPWFKTGFDAMKSASAEYGEDREGGIRRHWQPPDTTNRLLFIDGDDPFLFWEHQYSLNNSWKNWDVCLSRNKIDSTCHLCDRFSDRYPSFTGLSTVINMTEWVSKKGRKNNYQRELFAPKMGGKDKPGVLKKLERMKAKHGRIKGLVFDVFRSGAKSETCGDEFELIEKVDDFTAYRNAKLGEFLADVNKSAPQTKDGKPLTMETLLKWNPWERFEYEKIIKAKTNKQLQALFSGETKKSDFDDSGKGEEGSSDVGTDDIPF